VKYDPERSRYTDIPVVAEDNSGTSE